MRYSRISRVQGDSLIVPFWLTFDSSGNVRLTRNEPDVGRNERAMKMTVTVPSALFKTPTISATLTIDAPELSALAIDTVAAAEALKGAIGCDIDVRVTPAEPARDSDGSPEGRDAQRLDAEHDSAGPKGIAK